ncbi:MAG: Bax inhibitor-1/YccA family protein, partial [Ferruginibacter sp.]
PIASMHEGNTMTVAGSLQKFAFLFILLMGTAFYAWKEVMNYGSSINLMIWGGAIGGLVVAIIIMFKKEWSPFLAPVYALLEGLFVGAISAMYNNVFEDIAPNLVMNAVGLTFGVGIAMYLLFSFRIIQATQKFKAVVFTATAGIAIFYFIVWILSIFGVSGPAFLHEGSMLGIGFSLFVVAIAALNLILDFDMIEQGSQMGAPKYMEWYGAFGLMVTFVWLYLEILRLLSKFASRD